VGRISITCYPDHLERLIGPFVECHQQRFTLGIPLSNILEKSLESLDITVRNEL
jgi:hypothetical protein